MTVGRAALAATLAVFLSAVLGSHYARAQNLDLPVPRVTLYPGDTVENEHLYERAFVAQTVARATVFDGRRAVVGKVALRTLLPGQPIPVTAVREPYVIAQGKSALVVFQEGGITITSQAVALQNGGVGDVVSLRNIDSGAIIRGTVEADGTIRLGSP